MTTQPLLSVITVNYNGLALTEALIRSLHAHVACSLEIVVVDNGSQRDEAAVLRQRFPDIIALRSEANLGFAGGNNLGIAAATGRYLLLLNNDTEVEDGSLEQLVRVLDADPTIGVVCPKIRFFYPPRAIQFAGYTPLTHITLRNALIGFGATDDGSFDTPRDTPYAHGAAMMLRREAVEKAGLMPECYFLYYEELDWSELIRKAGFRIVYSPLATIFHKESATTGQQSPLRTYYITRNRLLFARRNRNGVTRVLSLIYQLGVALPKNAAVAAAKGRFDLVAASLKGAFDFLCSKTGKR